jgi:predicted RNase H-like HicB family nuclease
MKYTILIEKGSHNYSAYLPDVPGCVATGTTLEEVKQKMQKALQFHLEGLIEDAEAIPESTILCDYIEVKIPTITAM